MLRLGAARFEKNQYNGRHLKNRDLFSEQFFLNRRRHLMTFKRKILEKYASALNV